MINNRLETLAAAESYISLKKKIIVSIFRFLMAIMIVMEVVTTLANVAVSFPFLTVCLLIFLQYLLFIKFSSITLSGNLLLLTIYASLISETMMNGGLYSDNLLFLITIIPIAVLILDIRQTIGWAVINLFVLSYFYYLEVASPGTYLSQANFEPFYYFNALAWLFILISGTIICSGFILYNTYKKLHAQKIASIEHQKELILHQDELMSKQKELLKVNEQLQEMEKSLKKSNQDLERFAYATSHDLKQPVRVMSSFASLMARRMEQLSIKDESMEEYLQFIQSSGASMTTLIEQLMEYARAKNHDRDTEAPVDVNRLVETIILQLNLKNRGKQVNLKTVVELDSIEVTGNSSRLRQLFQNLISNAVKFSAKSKKPLIHIGSYQTEEEYCFFVYDNGIGIPMEQQDKVFHLFAKLHKKEEYEGTGIGLSTCKEIVEQHGGKIWVDPHTTEGCKICFSIPKSKIRKPKSFMEVLNN